MLINVEGSAVERTAGRTLLPSMHAAWSIGAAVGSGIGAACAALSITPATQLLGEAVLIVAAAFWVAAGIPPGQHGPAEGPPQDRAARLRQWLRGWLDWRLLLIGVVMLGCELGEGSANSWLTLAAHSDHGQSAAVAALFFTVFAASEGLTRLFAGPVVDRLGRVRTVRLTTALGVVGIALFIVAGNPWIILIGVALWAIGVSMGFPLGMSAAAESGPEPGRPDQRGRLDRLFRQPGRAARDRRPRPVGEPTERPVGHRRPVHRRLRGGRRARPRPRGRGAGRSP